MPRHLRLLSLLALALTARATTADLAEVSTAKDAAELRARLTEARAKVDAIEDPAIRALTAGTLEALDKKPGDREKILALHAARLDEIINKVPETLFLTGLTECKTDQEVINFARRTYARVSHVKDPVSARIVKFTLAKLEDRPGEAAAILKEHLKQIGERFLESAGEAFAANNAQACLENVQIAIRCDPANIRARFLFAHLLHTGMGETAKAVQTLRVGLEYITPADKDSYAYLDRYFQLLESREEDAIVIETTGKLLEKRVFDENATEMLAMHLATCLYWSGKYEACVRVITNYRLGVRAQGRLLHARALFDGRQTPAAVGVLDRAAADFTGAERDAILSQLQRFWTELGDNSKALSVADQRIRENPSKGSPRVHRIWIFDRQGDVTLLNRELRKLKEEFGNDQSVLLGLAQYAADRGNSALAVDCLRRSMDASFNKPLFALLAMESHVNAREYASAVDLYTRLNMSDRTFFKEVMPSTHAILAAAKYAMGDAASRSASKRHLADFLASPKLRPEAYMAAARMMRRVGDLESALRILEKGRQDHDWNNQLRADLAVVRIVSGNTAAYGTRPAIESELRAIAKERRVNPRLWDTVLTWLDTEAKLSPETQRQLKELASGLARPDLTTDTGHE